MSSCLLHEGFIVNELYTVELLFRKSDMVEHYCVKDNHNRKRILKLIRITSSGCKNELSILKGLKHPNIIRLIDEGTVIIHGQVFHYSVLDDVGDISLTRYVRENALSFSDIVCIIAGIANGINYLQKQEKVILHSNLNPDNVFLKIIGKAIIPIIINFENAHYETDTNMGLHNLHLFFQAPERLRNINTIYSEQYALGTMLYYLFEGVPIWLVGEAEILEKKHFRQEGPWTFNNLDLIEMQNVILKALNKDPRERFSSISHFIEAIHQYSGDRELIINEGRVNKAPLVFPKMNTHDSRVSGFNAVSGMEELKRTIQIDIIDALNDKERYEKYGLSIPNGMLFYGPPGCGKTFFAEKMAEEIGFSFFSVKPSDIQSKWVNASQENIKKLFEEARSNAPSLIFIDELDAIGVSRDNDSVSHMNTSIVNELLAQINNCGDDNVFVVGATNRYEAIDQALLRKGRLDKHIYFPKPDFEARKGLFELYLGRRPISKEINYEELACKSSQLVASDIKFICDEAARNALQKRGEICQSNLLKVISDQLEVK